MIWAIFAIMTGVAVFSVLWPLGQGPTSLAPAEPDVAFYKTQTDAIARDVSAGLMSPADAELAKAEAARRLLAERNDSKSAAGLGGSARRATAVASLILLPLVTVGFYLSIGSPDVPDAPLLARVNAAPAQMDINAAMARIEDHLAKEPEDGQGWMVVGPVYLQEGRYADAANAFKKATDILGETAERDVAIGQALVYAASGQVTDEAATYLRAALKLQSDLVAPQFYLGLAAQQSGDKQKAISIWSTLLASAPPGAQWVPSVQEQLKALGAEPPQTKAGAIASLAPADRNAVIRTMVEGLAGRLAANGGSKDEWLRLVRAYSVLGETDKAKAALASARTGLKDDATARTQLDALARELGLES